MSRNFRLLFCFFQFYCFLKEALTQNSVTKDDLGELYKAFVQDLVYIDREYKKLDSDAVLGLRVAEGYLKRLLQDAERGKIKLKLKVFNDVEDLLHRVSNILKKITPLVMENDPLFYPLLNSQWTYYKPYMYREQDYDEGQKDEADAERFSQCVGEITGSRISNSDLCTISDDCWEAMMTKGAPTSVLYYQVMFFILGEASGCLNKMTLKMKSSGVTLSDHLQQVCRTAYLAVAYLNFRGGGDPEGLISVLKLSFSCGLYGYHEILEERGLSNVIGWQLSSGCYGDYSKVGEEKSAALAKKGKLKSSYLGNGCYSDVTGIGLGLLAVYLRWVLDPPPQVQPVNLVLSAQQDAQTVTVYMMGLVLLTVAFLIAARRHLLQMVSAFCIILLGKRTR
ncbi:hypothetical protein ABFA07_011886 [Porites harrisoni]